MGRLAHLSEEQRADMRDSVRDASAEAYGGGAVLRARAACRERGLLMHVRAGGIRIMRADAVAGELPVRMCCDADAVLAWLAETPTP